MKSSLAGRGPFTLITGLSSAWFCLVATPAQAHLSFEQGSTHLSRYGDGEIKDGPCGRDGGTRGTNVYTYEPGQTITIETVEFIPHPGYFRIAFDDDGDDDFLDPQSIKPVDPERACPYDGNDKCGESDFYNNDTVLMDNLEPHLSSGKKTYSWQVKLPDIECDNCTLQVIQVMEDTIHGPYAPKGTADELLYIEDVYHQCIDLVLKRGASPDDNPTPPGNGDGDEGIVDGAGGDGAGGDGASGDGASGDGATGEGPGNVTNDDAAADSSDGCSAGPGRTSSAGALALLALGFLAVRRRRTSPTES